MPSIVAVPAVPAVLVLKGPCTPPSVPDDPPPAPKVNNDPVVEPDKVVFVPASAILGWLKLAVWLPAAPPDPIE